MQGRWTWRVLLSAGIVVTVLYCAGSVWATAPSGFTGTTLAVGRFGEIDVFNHFMPQNFGQDGHTGNWLSMQKTEAPSDVYLQSNVWVAGGSTGWHTHPGHSLIIVTAGTVTAYAGDDPDCEPSVYTTGMGIVDSGGGHVHLLRNEGAVEARTVAVQVIPASATRRIDAEDPGNCPF